MSILMKIRPVGAESYSDRRMDERKDGLYEANSGFLQFCEHA